VLRTYKNDSIWQYLRTLTQQNLSERRRDSILRRVGWDVISCGVDAANDGKDANPHNVEGVPKQAEGK
jgi:hypothetical protein